MPAARKRTKVIAQDQASFDFELLPATPDSRVVPDSITPGASDEHSHEVAPANETSDVLANWRTTSALLAMRWRSASTARRKT